MPAQTGETPRWEAAEGEGGREPVAKAESERGGLWWPCSSYFCLLLFSHFRFCACVSLCWVCLLVCTFCVVWCFCFVLSLVAINLFSLYVHFVHALPHSTRQPPLHGCETLGNRSGTHVGLSSQPAPLAFSGREKEKTHTMSASTLLLLLAR